MDNLTDATAGLPLGSIDDDFLVRAVDLARFLHISANEISRLTQSAVLIRVPDPANVKAYLYPCLANVSAYTQHTFQGGYVRL